jgi:hypothetical protein
MKKNGYAQQKNGTPLPAAIQAILQLTKTFSSIVRR